jgi:NADH-quinone oxidoreductase subunit E
MTSLQSLLESPFPALPALQAAPLGAHAMATLKRAQSHAQDLQARVAGTLKDAGEGLGGAAAFFGPLDAPSPEEATARVSDLFSTRFIALAQYQAAAGAAALDLTHYWMFGETAPAAAKAAAPAPVAAEPTLEPTVAAEPAPVPASEELAQPLLFAETPAASDDLRAIKGIGPKIKGVLNALGIYTYAQIADWSPAEVAWVEDKLDFRGRVTREGWQAQAQALLADGAAAV